MIGGGGGGGGLQRESCADQWKQAGRQLLEFAVPGFLFGIDLRSHYGAEPYLALPSLTLARARLGYHSLKSVARARVMFYCEEVWKKQKLR